MKDWEMFYDSMSKDERLMMWTWLAHKVGYSREIKSKLIIYSPAIYRLHQAIIVPFKVAYDRALVRLMFLFTCLSVLMLAVHNYKLSTLQVYIMIGGNLAISIMLNSIYDTVSFIIAYLRR